MSRTNTFIEDLIGIVIGAIAGVVLTIVVIGSDFFESASLFNEAITTCEAGIARNLTCEVVGVPMYTQKIYINPNRPQQRPQLPGA